MKCPACQADMIKAKAGHMCPACGYAKGLKPLGTERFVNPAEPPAFAVVIESPEPTEKPKHATTAGARKSKPPAPHTSTGKKSDGGPKSASRAKLRPKQS